QGARGRPRGRGGAGAYRPQERAVAAAAVQEPGRPGLPRVALRRGVGRLQPRGRARPRSRGRRVLQARQHCLQAERPGAGGPVVAQGAGDQPQARARQGESGHVERAVVTPEQDERAFRALTRKISDARGVLCEAYKEKCLRRRIAVRMRARGVHTFEDYARLLDGDAAEYDLLLDALTINVTAEAPRRPGPALQRLVRVLKHDLTSEPPPAPPYDLIVCRNVVIYFDRPMQERLFLAFAEALAPGGILLLGKVETLFGAVRERLVLEEPRERIYRRPL